MKSFRKGGKSMMSLQNIREAISYVMVMTQMAAYLDINSIIGNS